MAKATEAPPGYVPGAESIEMRRQIAEHYAGVIPELRMAFARRVFKMGEGAMAPSKDSRGKYESWQAVGRRLYGPKFTDDLRKVVEENRVVAEQ